MTIKVNRIFKGKESFNKLFVPLVNMEIDRIIEQQEEFKYNGTTANTSHSKGVA